MWCGTGAVTQRRRRAGVGPQRAQPAGAEACTCACRRLPTGKQASMHAFVPNPACSPTCLSACAFASMAKPACLPAACHTLPDICHACVPAWLQFDVLWPGLSAREHLQLMAGLRGLPKEQHAAQAQALLEQVGCNARLASSLCEGLKPCHAMPCRTLHISICPWPRCMVLGARCRCGWGERRPSGLRERTAAACGGASAWPWRS